MVPIVIERNAQSLGHNWIAYIVTSEKGIYEIGTGDTQEQAVGDLILKNLITFNVIVNAIKK